MLGPRVRDVALGAIGGDELLEDACIAHANAFCQRKERGRDTRGRNRAETLTVLVAQTVAPHGELLGCGRVEVARGEAAKTTVSETSIALLVNEIFEIKAELLDSFLILVLKAQVEERVIKGTAHEELEREVVRRLGDLRE